MAKSKRVRRSVGQEARYLLSYMGARGAFQYLSQREKIKSRRRFFYWVSVRHELETVIAQGR